MLFAPPDVAARVARRLREAGITAHFFGPLRLAAPTFLDTAAEAAEGIVLAAPTESSGPAAQRFRARHGKGPSAAAAYGYDGAAVLIDALRTGDSGDIESVRAALAATRRDGMTGRIEFDPSGNRAGGSALSQVEHGHLRPLHRDPNTSTSEPVSLR
jgi:branched-chain amino acid transport system substrate-binding protein